MSAEEPTVDPAPAESMDTEEPDVPEEPVEARRSGRARKNVDHFTIAQAAEKAETQIPEGKGTELGEIANIQKRLGALKADNNLVKKLYSVCFGTQGRKTVTKKHLRLFNGWSSDAQAENARKKLAGWDAKNILKPLCSLLDVDSNGTKQELQDALVAFLKNPEDTGKEFVPLQKAGTRKRKAAPSKKSTKKSTKKNDGEPKKLSGYIMFSMDARPKIKAKHPEYSFGDLQQAVAKKWAKVSDEDKEEWKEKGANYAGSDKKKSAKKPAAKKKKAAAKKPAKKKQKREESEPEEESEEESEEDEELQENITKAVKKIVNSGDLSTLTKGKVREAVGKEFGQDAVAKYKSHIKDVMTEAVAERQEKEAEGGGDAEEKEEKEEAQEEEAQEKEEEEQAAEEDAAETAEEGAGDAMEAEAAETEAAAPAAE